MEASVCPSASVKTVERTSVPKGAGIRTGRCRTWAMLSAVSVHTASGAQVSAEKHRMPRDPAVLGFAVPARNSKDPDGSKQTRDPFSLHPILPWGHKTSPNKLYLLIWKRHSINEDRRDKPHAERKTALTKNSTSNAIRSNEYFFNQKKKIKFRFLPSSPIFFLPLSAAIEVWEQKELCYRNTELYFLICEVGCLKAL